MDKLKDEAIEKVSGGYVVEGTDENGNRVWHVYSLATGQIAGTFDNTLSAVKFDMEINKQFYD
jgi:hypothetical protein